MIADSANVNRMHANLAVGRRCRDAWLAYQQVSPTELIFRPALIETAMPRWGIVSRYACLNAFATIAIRVSGLVFVVVSAFASYSATSVYFAVHPAAVS